MLALVCSSCIAPAPRGRPLTGPDPQLTPSSYIEEGKLLALVVGTRAARIRPRWGYVPLEVAIVNKGLGTLSLGLESFTLHEASGRRWAAVSEAELKRDPRFVRYDLRHAETPSVLGSQFPGYERIESALTFFRLDRPVPRTLYLPRRSYAVDFLYFPVPPDGFHGPDLELWLTAPELDEPVFVRFVMPGADLAPA